MQEIDGGLKIVAVEVMRSGQIFKCILKVKATEFAHGNRICSLVDM
jgi:hypothetical protein